MVFGYEVASPEMVIPDIRISAILVGVFVGIPVAGAIYGLALFGISRRLKAIPIPVVGAIVYLAAFGVREAVVSQLLELVAVEAIARFSLITMILKNIGEGAIAGFISLWLAAGPMKSQRTKIEPAGP